MLLLLVVGHYDPLSVCVCVLWSSPRWSLCYPAPCPSPSLSHVSSPHHHHHHHRQHSPKCPSSSSSSSSIQSKTVSVWPYLALICALKRLRRRRIMMPMLLVLLVLLVPLIRSTCLLSRLHCFKTGQSVWERGIRCPFDACFGIDSSMNHHRRCHYHHHHHHHHYT